MNLFHKILILLVGIYHCPQLCATMANFRWFGFFEICSLAMARPPIRRDGTSVEGSEPQASVAVPVNGLVPFFLATPPSRAWGRLILLYLYRCRWVSFGDRVNVALSLTDLLLRVCVSAGTAQPLVLLRSLMVQSISIYSLDVKTRSTLLSTFAFPEAGH